MVYETSSPWEIAFGPVPVRSNWSQTVNPLRWLAYSSSRRLPSTPQKWPSVLQLIGFKSNKLLENANSVVILVPSAIRFSIPENNLFCIEICHLRRFTFKKQGFPSKGKSRAVIASKKPLEINFSLNTLRNECFSLKDKYNKSLQKVCTYQVQSIRLTLLVV